MIQALGIVFHFEACMKIAMIGLGRMGLGLSRRLIAAGHKVVGYDADGAAVLKAESLGVEGAGSLAEAVAELDGESPRLVWLMLPAGKPTGQAQEALSRILSPGDIVVDGGNSDYRDTLKNGPLLAKAGIRLIDCGTSGGLAGAEAGYCLMAGGEAEAMAVAQPLLQSLA
jgi:6-phosphogluconate dehydrogenase